MNDNPLKQFFRRPAIYIKLPSEGKFYPNGTLEMTENGELPVYPMTAIDEITSKTPDALYNGSALINIIKSCIPNIKDPWVIPVIDLDPILIGIKVATNGNDLDIDSKCPSCNNEGKYGVNLVGLLSTLKAGDYDSELIIGDLKFKFAPLTYKKINQISTVQFEIEKTMTNLNSMDDNNEQKLQAQKDTMFKLNEMGMDLIAEGIVAITTPTIMVDNKQYIIDFLKNCDKNTYEKLRDYTISLRQSSEIKPVPIQCVNCSHQYQQSLTLNPTDFFV